MIDIKGKWRDNGPIDELFSSNPLHVGIIAFPKLPLFQNLSFLTEEYCQNGLSAKQIAAKTFSSKSSVTAALHKAKIPVRTPHRHHGHISQPRYGDKVRNEKLVAHQAERRVIEAVMNLKSEGLSLRKIALVLDQMKIPTKEQGRKWHPEMIRRILSFPRTKDGTDN